MGDLFESIKNKFLPSIDSHGLVDLGQTMKSG